MTPKVDIVTFHPSVDEFIDERNGKKITVLSGSNNSGKTFFLKQCAIRAQGNPYLVGVNRFFSLVWLQSGGITPFNSGEYKRQYRDSIQNISNIEHNLIDLQGIIKNLSDAKRDLLLSICSELLGNRFSIQKTDPENSFSESYIDMDGQNLSISSSGTRLLITLLGISLNEYFTSLFIDEPEIGLSPKLQAILVNYFFKTENQARYFPHLQQIVFATHSHLFLDRNDISNNFVISKTGQDISINRIQNMIEFHRLQFNMLGNTFESMFFPSAIVIVEGKTDFKYLDKVIRLHLSDKKVSVIQANDDSRTKEVINSLKNTFGDLNEIPYRERIFVVLDSIHNPGLQNQLEQMGVLPENIIVWANNGIEYVYPSEIMTSIYHCSNDDISQLSMNGDRIELNGITKTKNNLADEVLSRLTSETILPEELETKLLNSLNVILD